MGGLHRSQSGGSRSSITGDSATTFAPTGGTRDVDGPPVHGRVHTRNRDHRWTGVSHNGAGSTSSKEAGGGKHVRRTPATPTSSRKSTKSGCCGGGLDQPRGGSTAENTRPKQPPPVKQPPPRPAKQQAQQQADFLEGRPLRGRNPEAEQQQPQQHFYEVARDTRNIGAQQGEEDRTELWQRPWSTTSTTSSTTTTTPTRLCEAMEPEDDPELDGTNHRGGKCRAHTQKTPQSFVGPTQPAPEAPQQPQQPTAGGQHSTSRQQHRPSHPTRQRRAVSWQRRGGQ